MPKLQQTSSRAVHPNLIPRRLLLHSTGRIITGVLCASPNQHNSIINNVCLRLTPFFFNILIALIQLVFVIIVFGTRYSN